MARKSLFDVKVLMVENNEEYREKAKAILGEGFRFAYASTIKETFDYLKEYYNETALILLNVKEKRLDGIELLNKLEEEGYLSTIPVIAMSYEPTEELMNIAYDFGVADYLNLASNHESSFKRIRNTIRTYVHATVRNMFHSDRDMLTGSLNLDGLRKSFKRFTAEYPDTEAIIIFLDIRNFKFFNTNFGFDAGNRLLVYTCHAIRQFMKDGDLICRITGDQLALFLPKIDGHTEESHFDEIIEDIRGHFAGRFGEFIIDIIAGEYVYVPALNRHETLDEMLGYAKQAQLVAKAKEGSGFVEFTDDLWRKQQRKMEINGHIDAAIEEGEILVYLQPQYNYVSGELTGAECLCRWNHKTLGMLTPGEFIPCLEESGNIYKLDRYVWEKACQYIRKWTDEGHPIHLSVNVSRKDIEAANLPEVFMDLMAKYHLSPSMLHIEITESAYIDGQKKLTELIKSFSTLGFSVEMDDFGSGFSSLNLLHDVEVDVLKLDMGFLNDGNGTVKSGNIINAIVRMAHVLDIGVLAEGVETLDQAEFLKNIGCVHAQGYFFSKPVPVEEFEKIFEHTSIAEEQTSIDKYQLFNIQELFDRRSSGFFIFNNCMGAAALFEYDGALLQPLVVNDEFVSTLEWERERLEKNRKNVFPAFSKRNRERLIEILNRGLVNGSASGELFSVSTQKHLYVFIRHISSYNGVELFFCELTDISEKKEMESEILELQKIQAAQMEFMPCGTFKCENGGEQRITYVSDSLVTMFGYKSKEDFVMSHLTYMDMVYEEDREAVTEHIESHNQADEVVRFDHRIKKADGTLIWVYENGRINKDDDGKEWVYGVITDIDTVKRQSLETRWYEQKLRTLLEIPNVVLYEYDPESDRMTLSVCAENGERRERTAYDYMERVREERWIHEDDVDEFADNLQKLIEEGGYKELFVRAIFKDGTYHLCKYTFSCTMDEKGKVNRIIGRAENVEKMF